MGLFFKSGVFFVYMWLVDVYLVVFSLILVMFFGLVIKIGGVYVLVRIFFSIYGVSVSMKIVGWVIIIFVCIIFIVGNVMVVI